MPVTSCFVISGPHPAEEKDNHLTLMLTSAQPSLFSSAAPLLRGTFYQQKETPDKVVLNESITLIVLFQT